MRFHKTFFIGSDSEKILHPIEDWICLVNKSNSDHYCIEQIERYREKILDNIACI